MGYAVQVDGDYRPIPRFLEIGGETRKRMAIYRVVKPDIQELAIKTGDHANLIVEENDHEVFLSKFEDQYCESRHARWDGCSPPYHRVWESMLAFIDDDRRRSIIDAHGLSAVTGHTISDEETFRAEPDEIRERGPEAGCVATASRSRSRAP